MSAALHGAKVIVDEKGTETAAAAAMMFLASPKPQADLAVVADRPFLWTIVHQETGALLFIGRLVDPTTQPIRLHSHILENPTRPVAKLAPSSFNHGIVDPVCDDRFAGFRLFVTLTRHLDQSCHQGSHGVCLGKSASGKTGRCVGQRWIRSSLR